MLFAESDASGSESNAVVTAPVRVEGDNTENLTVIATPLTVAQYQADPGRYRNSCDSIIQDAATHNLNPAEGECMAPIRYATNRYSGTPL